MKLASCPHCAGHIDLKGLKPGLTVQCPHCKGLFTVPLEPAAAEPAATFRPPPQAGGLQPPPGGVPPHMVQQPRPQGLSSASTVGIIVAIVFAVIFVVGILALIAIPNFIHLRSKAYDASAQSAGRNAKSAEEIYYLSAKPSTYTDSLDSLLVFDSTLLDDPDVTFEFGSCNSEGYTFTTVHAKGSGEEFPFIH
ncbi:MAG: hypothetical protein P9L99_17915 [Candidatus Lernaella stagnicola]|nr:hypothetical protein [Candidatus Lernaella stagnicola]